MGPPPDYRNAWLDAAFRYTDTTPPQLWYGFSDVPNQDGWFNRDVTLYRAWMDNESAGDLDVRVRHGGHRCRYARHDLHVHRDQRGRHGRRSRRR